MGWRGYDVTYGRNFTGVDDKIIKRANERGIPALSLSQIYIQAYHEDMDRLGVARADVEPLVSTHIAEIIAIVERLIARGHGYSVDGDVYFDVASYPPYGGLSKRPLEELEAGGRVAVDGGDRNRQGRNTRHSHKYRMPGLAWKKEKKHV